MVAKIIVGISLIQAITIYTEFKRISNYFGYNILGGIGGGATIFALTSVASFCLGFLFFYLETRTRIMILLTTVDTLTRPEETLERVAAASPQLESFTPSKIEGQPPQEGTAEDKEIVLVPFNQLDSPEKLSAWGAAQMRLGNPAAAAQAFEAALKKRQDDPTLYLAQAGAKMRLNQGVAASSVLEEATSRFPNDPVVLRNKLLTSLYLPKPQSFQEALAAAEKLAQLSPKDLNDPMVQLWIAAANGQKYKFVEEPSEKEEAKAGALKAVATIVNLAPSPNERVRVLMRQLFDPAREKSSPSENDLEVFKDFDDIRRLVYANL